MEDQDLKLITEEMQKILDLVNIEAAVKVQTDEAGVVHLSLDSENAGLLIGYYGQTLAALQLVFNLIIYRKLGTWVKIVLNVGDWRERREEYLKNLALNLAQRVEASGEPAACPYLSAAERRIVHLALQDHTQVVTESEGEGEDRRLIVRLKT